MIILEDYICSVVEMYRVILTGAPIVFSIPFIQINANKDRKEHSI